MSCKLWGQVASVSVDINFGSKMSILCKKIEILGEMLTFSLSVHYYREWLSFCKICLFFLEKCDNFDSKYHFVQWYFGQECHFPSKIYITLGMNSLEKLSNFLRKVLI